MISKETIEEIRKQADIVKVISEYVALKKRGRNYLALCPFHSEKTASFVVSPDKGIYHCFGCHEGGNVFSFIMKTENVSFQEAAEILAGKLNLTIKRVGGGGRRPETGDRERYYEITSAAVKFYADQLMEPVGDGARKYLTDRKVHPKTVATFKLGYASEDWDKLFKFLLGRGYKPEELEKAGLVLPRQGGSGYYDRFRARILFPIFDLQGRAIAFSGRVLDAKAEGPKYLNSPDTPIFNKGLMLYGLNLAVESIKKHKTVILVEGNLDLVSCYQAGITQVAAPLGTGFTLAQAKLLGRFAKRVIFAFDRDEAGVAAMERCLPSLREVGLEVSVAILEGGKDPDEVIREKGVEPLVASLKAASPWMQFKINQVLSRFNLNQIEGKAKAAAEVAALLAEEENQIIQKEYLKAVATRLGIAVDDLVAEVRRQGAKTEKAAASKSTSLRKVLEKPASRVFEAEKNLLLLVLKNKEILAALPDLLDIKELKEPLFQEVFTLLLSEKTADPEGTVHAYLNGLEDEARCQALSKVLVEELPPIDEKVLLKDCLKVFREEHLKAQMKQLKEQLLAAEKGVKTDEVRQISSAITRCSQQLHELRAL